MNKLFDFNDPLKIQDDIDDFKKKADKLVKIVGYMLIFNIASTALSATVLGFLIWG